MYRIHADTFAVVSLFRVIENAQGIGSGSCIRANEGGIRSRLKSQREQIANRNAAIASLRGGAVTGRPIHK